MASPDPNIEEEMMDDEEQPLQQELVFKTSRIGIEDVVRRIWKQDGISGFYRALSSQLLCIFVSDMVYFFAVTLVKQLLYGKREVDAFSNLKASSIAGTVCTEFKIRYWNHFIY